MRDGDRTLSVYMALAAHGSPAPSSPLPFSPLPHHATMDQTNLTK